jgi:hypothetical protein
VSLKLNHYRKINNAKSNDQLKPSPLKIILWVKKKLKFNIKKEQKQQKAETKNDIFLVNRVLK